MKTVWQIAAGEAGRRYADLCIRHDIVLIGHGRFGPYTDGDWAKIRPEWRNPVRRFATEMGTDDDEIVLLRSGKKVVAIGLTAQPGYHYNEGFSDVLGWDLQHTRRVIWQDHLVGDLENLQRERNLFADRKQIPKLTRVADRRILKHIEPLIPKLKRRPLRDLPKPPSPELDDDALGEALFAKGLPNEAVDKVLLAIQRQRRLINWYQHSDQDSGRPTEHEVVAHMILPLMLALGWSEQLLAVEWKSIDLAAFHATPTTQENCIMVCEAKGYGRGLEHAFSQGVRYTKTKNLLNCRQVAATDGSRIVLYEREEGSWPDEPVGYLNITEIRRQYLIPANTDGVDTIIALTPAGAAGQVPKQTA